MCFASKPKAPAPAPPPVTNKATEVQTAARAAKKPKRTQSIFGGEQVKKEKFG